MGIGLVFNLYDNTSSSKTKDMFTKSYLIMDLKDADLRHFCKKYSHDMWPLRSTSVWKSERKQTLEKVGTRQRIARYFQDHMDFTDFHR